MLRGVWLGVVVLIAACWPRAALAAPGGAENTATPSAVQDRQSVALAAQYKDTIRPLLERYCYDCHGREEPEGDLALVAFDALNDVLKERRKWKRVWEVLHAREMPPEKETQPSAEQREQLAAWIEQVLSLPDPGGVRDPGHVALRRLNQTQYNNTVIDLFGIRRKNSYFQPERGMPETVRLILFRNDRLSLVDLPPDDVGYGYDNIGEVLSLPPFLMEKYFAAAGKVVEAGMAQGRLPGRLSQRGGGQPAQAARQIIAEFATRAFRRPVSEEEIDRFVKLYDLAIDRGEEHEAAMRVPLQAMLVSPYFLFRVEKGDAARESAGGVRPLTDYELATRLSYFLWNSMPDDPLFEAARQNRLCDPAEMKKQALRMLRNSRAKELSESFALQWLQISNIRGAMPDPDRYPTFFKLKYLPHAYRQEALLVFETIMVEDRSVLELIDADYTWMNGVLAQFYGIEGDWVRERNSSLFWRRVPLPDKRRGGVITMAGPLLAMSNSTRTNPVKRGKWVLETILGAPPPPPLANVADLDDTPPAEDGLTLRVKLERHRADPNCASCHRRMDPIGLGLENYDGIGAWREKDGPLEIDARGELIDGSTFDGPVELKQFILQSRRKDFVRCLTEHMMTYALGRPLDYYDAAAVGQIVRDVEANDFRFSALVTGIVTSNPFCNMRPAETSHEKE